MSVGAVYYEHDVRFAHSGAEGQLITLAAYRDEQVILDGSRASDGMPGITIIGGQGLYLIRGLTIREMPWSGIYTDEEATVPFREIYILDCVLHNNGRSGIDLAGVRGFLVAGVEAYDNAYYGLNIISAGDGQVSSADGEVRDSRFYNHTGQEGHGLAINQGHDIVVRRNVAYHNAIRGFDVSDWPKGGELSYNLVLESNLSYDNGMAGFSTNSDSHHLVYRNNIAWGNGADWAGKGSCSGFLCYEGCWHVEFYNNVSAMNSDAGFTVEDAWGAYSQPEDSLLVFKNNIAYDNGRPEWDERPALVVHGPAWQVVAECNNWSGPSDPEDPVLAINLVDDKGQVYSVAQLNAGEFQVDNFSLDPLFVDPRPGDFRLSPNSPMIDKGLDIGLPFCRTAPDLGAIESCP